MAMTVVWTAMVCVSVLCGAATGRLSEVSAAAGEGAASAVELCLSMAGMLCLWNGVMEALGQCGALVGLRKGLQPILGCIFPEYAPKGEVMDAIAANVSANLLGLGNAATPLGIRAAALMAQDSPGVASDALCRLVVCNTASIQLLPTTVASVRAAAGCEHPFDLLSAVWFASVMSVSVGLTAAWVFSRLGRRKGG